MADRYDDARMDHLRAVPRCWRPHRAWLRACPGPLAMEYDRILRSVKRISGLGMVQAGRGVWKLLRMLQTIRRRMDPTPHGEQVRILTLCIDL